MGSVYHEADAAKKRLQVVQWLNTLYPEFNLPSDASDEELRAQLLDGVVLCAIIHRKNWCSIQNQRGVFISSDQRLYNVKRFLSTIDEMGLLKFNVLDLEQGYMSAVLDCLLSLRDRMSSGVGEGGTCDAAKFGSQPRNVGSMDVYRGNNMQSEQNSLFSGYERRRSFSESKLHNVMQNPTMSEPLAALLHPTGPKFHEISQLNQGSYSDLPTVKIVEMMKSSSFDNAPTQSLLSVANAILDESIERKNGEIPHRVACLLRKVIQEIERRISTQADHIRIQNNLIKAREEKYQSRIKVLETLASGTCEEAQMVSNQLQKTKTKIEESKKDGDQDKDRMMREKESSESTILELKQELENTKKLYENRCQQLERSSNEIKVQLEQRIKEAESQLTESKIKESQEHGDQDVDMPIREKENSECMISELKQELESTKKLYENRCQLLERNSNEIKAQLEERMKEAESLQESKKYGHQDMDRLMMLAESRECMISELKQELENTKKLYENRCQQLERNSNEIKGQLEKRIKEAESLLVESRKRTRELEAISESQFQNWNKKEHAFQNFIGFQLQSVKNMRVASESIKQEVIRTQKGWREEITSLGVKLKVLIDAAENYHKSLAENRRLYNEVQELKGNIRVYCRIRPFLAGQTGKSTSVEYIGENGEVLVVNPSKQGKDGSKMFKFNKVFGPASTQEEVYLDIQPLVRSVLDGYNVCIFAYGQSGSGKTYTMSGPNSPTKEEWGVNYRALNDLFNISHTRSNTFSYEIGVQMIEIYNEQVRDLLISNASQKKLGILSCSQSNGLAVPDASMLPVKSTSDVLNVMQFGQSNRAMSSTALNERSSRSHSVVTIHVEGMDLKTGSTSRGCLHLVDLAGSERVDRSEVKGDKLKEAQHINKSLSALGDVIFALSQKSSHVPYRNSKLTQVLQSSLGGHAKTLMFVQVNPDVDSYSETLSTLKFAERVSGVELGAAGSNKEGKVVRDLMEQVASLQDTIARKDEEIEALQLRNDIKANVGKTLKHSLSSPGMSSSNAQRGQLLNIKQVARLTEKVASDPVSSEFSDSEGRQSDISDGPVGAENETLTAESHFSEASKLSESLKEKMPKVSSRIITKPLVQKTKQTVSIQPKLKDPKSSVLKRSTTSQTTTSLPRTFRR